MSSHKMQHPFAQLRLDSFRHPTQHILSPSPTAEEVAKAFRVVVHARVMKNRVWYDCFYYANGQTCAVPVPPAYNYMQYTPVLFNDANRVT